MWIFSVIFFEIFKFSTARRLNKTTGAFPRFREYFINSAPYCFSSNKSTHCHVPLSVFFLPLLFYSALLFNFYEYLYAITLAARPQLQTAPLFTFFSLFFVGITFSAQNKHALLTIKFA